MPAAVVYRRSLSGPNCPACMEDRCPDPAECLHFLTSNPWADCSVCEGSGWADEEANPGMIFCEYCAGSGLNEHTVRSIALIEVSEKAKQRHAAHVARLIECVSQATASVGVAVAA
ncbi:hypothetical protein GCM10010363_38700 [Streptomyces omiyaensis]|uniref:hypothetical protein n=1 Tax=Streptomyces TaxID=1883 RepID=UPI0016765471|nr:hypothetical protein [Streptomyces omiyaensis]GGY53806.1 hypothetical protein GCM10010363_38700 [Streptomyces omiyaensis]